MQHMASFNGIVITKLANGWEVCLPNAGNSLDPMIQAAGKMFKEMKSDEGDLSEIMAKSNIVPAENNIKNIQATENVFVFLTYPEVITFLQTLN